MDKRQHESDLGPFSLPEVQPDNPNDKEQIGLEGNDLSKVNEVAVGRAVERNSGSVTSSAPTAVAQQTPAQALNPILANPTFNPSQSQQNSSASARLNAEDKDRIEKEWVHIAKAIVEQTKDDPYNQKKEVNKISKDYVKKRFNLDLKIDDNE
ncbi:MAG TPA: hypothetical protein VMR34_06200 [Candidatus Saccharimonadales bacterium]|nr:hypothetical protein [Candidatus Saccharimonadales bacterium]